ncbi:hypothetical protein [Streptomyces tsukubensis]|uniref:Integral membrane protein n=1 Tax=Streptomyces tsukubensis TaxID=83656 RepID=A0A1V4A0E7_9ACTN|nr:hypothetical protein [Streptomyces tsukubensis]OON72016.1 hypothetical protein B1H18_31575 [Streptomyces tsukubensis]QFR95746.1 hypothetical protein GBW32_25320 [Streptomyces tsukubensis]
MIVTLVIVCEVAFWVLLAAGLALRYGAHLDRAGAAVLLVEPLLEIVLLVVTAIDLKNGAEPDWKHGLAALYIGYTVAYGHYTVKWLDGYAAHRFGSAPAPVKPPKYGMARARHEGKLWLRTLLAAAVACLLLQLAIRYVGDPAAADPLRGWQFTALRVTAIHGVIALTYLVLPKRGPGKSAEGPGELPEGPGSAGERRPRPFRERRDEERPGPPVTKR